MKGFIEFIREQGVMGLAVGFILGGAVSKLVTAFVNDLVNPIVGVFLGRTGELKKVFLQIGSSKILWGDFVSSFIDFAIIAFVVYFGVKILRLETLYKKKGK
ncbi:MAG: MscL family protein [Candidatus Roizmanbacteria bacterium]|nr:MscL family protein [Candidatus Roizmanbacteria bacterium]